MSTQTSNAPTAPGPWVPRFPAKVWRRFWFAVRERLTADIRITDNGARYRFRCESYREYKRAVKMMEKEPGTCRWIQTDVGPGDVFWDVGANIGTFTLLAARRVDAAGRVFAFEPHAANFARLLAHIQENRLQHIVIPCNFALGEASGFFPFVYAAIVPGTSNSQLAPAGDDPTADTDREVRELKSAVTADSLVFDHGFPAPAHIKIDVDGNELKILKGMGRLLVSPARPLSIQVEINPADKSAVYAHMEQQGYRFSHRHFTRHGRKRIARGEDPEGHVYNVVFRPAELLSGVPAAVQGK